MNRNTFASNIAAMAAGTFIYMIIATMVLGRSQESAAANGFFVFCGLCTFRLVLDYLLPNA